MLKMCIFVSFQRSQTFEVRYQASLYLFSGTEACTPEIPSILPFPEFMKTVSYFLSSLDFHLQVLPRKDFFKKLL